MLHIARGPTCSASTNVVIMIFFSFKTSLILLAGSTRLKSSHYCLGMTSRKVAIIGAGAAGLIAADVLSKCDIDVEVLERNCFVGGVWKYNKVSAMYKSLVTNLPKEIMAYNDETPFDSVLPSFLTHSDVQAYLEKFCDAQSLNRFINLECNVTSVRRLAHSRWEIKYVRSNGETITSDNFTHVIVCNGHYDKPESPPIKGLELFDGRVMHSKYYDDPEEFSGQNVLVIGTRSSGTDLAMAISRHANVVHISDHNLEGSSRHYPSNIWHRPAIAEVVGHRTIRFTNEEEVNVDCIIYCTGYEFDMPFLSSQSDSELSDEVKSLDWTATAAPLPLLVQDRSVRPLFLQLFHALDPSLTFIGLPHSIVPFPLFYLQAKLIAASILGTYSLPSQEVRWKSFTEFESQFLDTKAPRRKYHYLGDKQWDYCLHLAELAGVADERLKAFVELNKQIYDDNSNHKPAYPGAPDTYRRRTYHVDRLVQNQLSIYSLIVLVIPL